jgi:hypothetical protein
MQAYRIDDVGGQELLFQACAMADRVTALRARIDADGEILITRGGVMKEHPGLRGELAGRAFIVKTLRNLGLDVEPVRPTVGRPGGGVGVAWDYR